MLKTWMFSTSQNSQNKFELDLELLQFHVDKSHNEIEISPSTELSLSDFTDNSAKEHMNFSHHFVTVSSRQTLIYLNSCT